MTGTTPPPSQPQQLSTADGHSLMPTLGLHYSIIERLSIGAEIGAMKVTEQIDALEANAVDAFKYLAVTRIIALMFAMPLLTIMMDFSGIVGG